MADEQIRKLLESHSVTESGSNYNIQVNIPANFIYDVSEIIVQFNPSTDTKKIICAKIPEKIKENMHKFNFLDIMTFLEVIEENLAVFFMGRIPELTLDADKSLPAGELPPSYSFPAHNSVTSNIRCDISKTGISFLCCEKIAAVVKCSKCTQSMAISGNTHCRNCRQDIGLVYVPVIENGLLGFLQFKKSDFVCFEPIKFQFECAECDKKYESTALGTGQQYARKCNGCFKELKIRINTLKYYPKKDVKIRLGEELPEKGTCKHYKKSYRWFRFSCCNTLYPCDICHNEDSGHQAEIAHRMVCGYCSKEQSVKQNCDCGMSMKRKHTQFWEGGQGNRDRSTMSKNDKKKYK